MLPAAFSNLKNFDFVFQTVYFESDAWKIIHYN
jgi:hypothetical protein